MEPKVKKTIQERFETYHERNPHVYEYLCGLARMVKAAGYNRYGIAGLFERARWHFKFERDRNERFKISDNYTSRYARFIMDNNEDLRDFFQVKLLRTP